MAQKFYSNGKLLLTGEYLVLDGAIALAIPTKYGQSLLVETIDEPKIIWESFDKNKKPWFEASFLLDEIMSPLKNDARTSTQLSDHTSTQLSDRTSTQLNDLISNKLLFILREAKKLNPEFLNSQTGFNVSTKLDFPRDWGLGSSSTLINNIARWSKVDAFKLVAKTFKGSGYDIAAAQHNKPITYSILNGDPKIEEVNLSWGFTNELFFVHLNKKQDSREGIARYYAQQKKSLKLIGEINTITSKIIHSTTLSGFEDLITAHEEIISKIIEQEPVKKLLFQDYRGSIKSLGAWGGDFILATGDKTDREYFRRKGFGTIVPFDEMVK